MSCTNILKFAMMTGGGKRRGGRGAMEGQWVEGLTSRSRFREFVLCLGAAPWMKCVPANELQEWKQTVDEDTKIQESLPAQRPFSDAYNQCRLRKYKDITNSSLDDRPATTKKRKIDADRKQVWFFCKFNEFEGETNNRKTRTL